MTFYLVDILNIFAIKELLIDTVYLHNVFQLNTKCVPTKIYCSFYLMDREVTTVQSWSSEPQEPQRPQRTTAKQQPLLNPARILSQNYRVS